MEESKQQRCHREARKYPRMHRKKLGATRKTFRSTRIRDRRESMKKRRDHKRSRKNSMNTMSLYLGVDQIRAHRGNLKPVANCGTVLTSLHLGHSADGLRTLRSRTRNGRPSVG